MLRKTVLGLFCWCAVLVAAAPAFAYDHPNGSTTYNVNLVRAFEPCATPNTSHKQPALVDISCTPPLPSNAGNLDAWEFDSNGKILVRYRATKGDVLIDASGTGIGDGNGTSASGPGTLLLAFKWTDSGCVAPDFTTDCTNIDVPLVANFTLTNGRFKLKAAANTVFGPFFGTELPHWRTGSTIAIEDVWVADETGARFAEPGLYVR